MFRSILVSIVILFSSALVFAETGHGTPPGAEPIIPEKPVLVVPGAAPPGQRTYWLIRVDKRRDTPSISANVGAIVGFTNPDRFAPENRRFHSEPRGGTVRVFPLDHMPFQPYEICVEKSDDKWVTVRDEMLGRATEQVAHEDSQGNLIEAFPLDDLINGIDTEARTKFMTESEKVKAEQAPGWPQHLTDYNIQLTRGGARIPWKVEDLKTEILRNPSNYFAAERTEVARCPGGRINQVHYLAPPAPVSPPKVEAAR